MEADVTAPEEPPHLTIQPQSGWRGLEGGELWEYRELLYFLTWRDVKVRYKQTVLGAAWAILQPLLAMIVFTIFFGRLGGMDEHVRTPYPLFVYAALLPWQFFAAAVSQSGQSLVASSHLISKVYFPRLLVPFGTVAAGLVDFAVSSLVMFGLMAWYAEPLTIHLLALPLCVAGTVLAAVGVGTLLSAVTVAYRDFRYVVTFLVQLWMFASPVAYPFDAVPPHYQLWYALNPMAGLISGFRSALLGEPFAWKAIAISCAVSLAVLLVGILYFRRVERRFADIV
jgi:lipopolysaccharide transport system permease protein